ncbi:MAG: hypothetical protein IIY78_09735 [Clostridia bacterium]|nr:hypothetical protein [Clostridia bacterium]
MALIQNMDGFSSSYIEQIYITTEDGAYARIRCRRFKDVCKYYYTVKQYITDITRFESEYEITAAEYDILRNNIKPNTRPITKKRICFLYKDQLFELDMYDFDNNFSTLEIELQSEEQEVYLPPFINIIKDATFDKSYSNYALAHKIQ